MRQEIRGIEITGAGVGEASILPDLLDHIPADQPIGKVSADGTIDAFTAYGGPTNQISLANTIGLPLYARQLMDDKDRWINILTEAAILPVNKRPHTAIRLFTCN